VCEREVTEGVGGIKGSGGVLRARKAVEARRIYTRDVMSGDRGGGGGDYGARRRSGLP